LGGKHYLEMLSAQTRSMVGMMLALHLGLGDANALRFGSGVSLVSRALAGHVVSTVLALHTGRSNIGTLLLGC